MALFSDIDWVIILGVGVFLLFGSHSAPNVMRTIGQYYGRLMSMKQQLVTEVSKAADVPASRSGQPTSLRAVFLGIDPSPTGHVSGIPAVVTTPPGPAYRPTSHPEIPWTGGGVPTPTWSVVLPPLSEPSHEVVR